jgi:flagellar FliL protein
MTTSQSSIHAASVAPARLPVLTLVAIVVAGIVLGALSLAGGAWWLLKSGRISLGKDVLSGTTSARATIVATHAVILDPILVNLADPGGHAYLRLGMTLVVEDGSPSAQSTASTAKSFKEPNEVESSLRDTVISVLGEQTGSSLLAAGGKEQLKAALLKALASHNPKVIVSGLYFTDYLVQL